MNTFKLTSRFYNHIWVGTHYPVGKAKVGIGRRELWHNRISYSPDFIENTQISKSFLSSPLYADILLIIKLLQNESLENRWLPLESNLIHSNRLKIYGVFWFLNKAVRVE